MLAWVLVLLFPGFPDPTQALSMSRAIGIRPTWGTRNVRECVVVVVFVLCFAFSLSFRCPGLFISDFPGNLDMGVPPQNGWVFLVGLPLASFNTPKTGVKLSCNPGEDSCCRNGKATSVQKVAEIWSHQN